MIQSAVKLPNDQLVTKQFCIMIVGTDPLMMRIGRIVNFDPDDLAIQIRHTADDRVYESLKTNAYCVDFGQPLAEVQLAIAAIQLLLDAPLARELSRHDFPCGDNSLVEISIDVNDANEVEVRAGTYHKSSRTTCETLNDKLEDVKQSFLQLVASS